MMGMDDQQTLRLAALLGLGLLLCMATVSYFDVPKFYSIQRHGAGVIDSAILWSAVIGTLIGLAIRRSATAAVVGFVVGVSLAMLACNALESLGPARE
jgi:hypothetical protein